MGIDTFESKNHFSGKANHHHRLWTLLMWEMWREKWLV
ncbi:conserved hypothetical protein [delta proteobacterium NaphS2]|nr:conserved hypothetical protein [delta proteobacterium NaphS2]